jgi:hypothetical protein
MLTWPDPKQQREASLSLISAACNRLTAATEEVRFLVGPAGDPVLFDQGPTVRTSLKKPWLVNDLSVKPSYRKKFLGPLRTDRHGLPLRHARTMHLEHPSHSTGHPSTARCQKMQCASFVHLTPTTIEVSTSSALCCFTPRDNFSMPLSLVRSECTQRAELETKALQGDKNALEVLSSVDRRNKKGKRKKAAVWMEVCGLLALCLAAYFLLHGER